MIKLRPRVGQGTSFTALGYSWAPEMSAPSSSDKGSPTFQLGPPIHLPRRELGQLPAGSERGCGSSCGRCQSLVGELEHATRSDSGPASDQVMRSRCGPQGMETDLRTKTLPQHHTEFIGSSGSCSQLAFEQLKHPFPTVR